jgi:hypothetical protein
MKQISLLMFALVFSAAFSSASFAKLIEDGSSFTGSYRVQETACEKSEFSYVTGQNILVPDFFFEGTPNGLKQDGNLMSLGTLQMINHGGGIQTGSYAQYVSSTEFVVGSVLIHPLTNGGQKTVTVDDYVIGTPGQITKTETSTIGEGQPTVTSICHFMKEN